MKYKIEKSSFSIAAIWIILTLLIGDFHPFDRYPMFNSFPNAAFYFHFSDENDELIPSEKLGSIAQLHGGLIAQMHSSMRQRENLPFFVEDESPEDRKVGGQLMLSQISSFLSQEKLNKLNCNSLKLIKVNLYIENDSIHERKYVLFSKPLEELLEK